MLSSCFRNENETSIFKELYKYSNVKKEIKQENELVIQTAIESIVLKKTSVFISPSGNSAKILNVLPGQKIILTGDSTINKEEELTYLSVEINEVTGWLISAYTQPVASLGVIKSTLKLYTSPDVLSNQKYELDYGDIVSVSNKATNGWYAIYVENAENRLRLWSNSLDGISFDQSDLELAFKRDILFSLLPDQEGLNGIQAIVDSTKYASSIFYDEFLDTLYVYKKDTLVVE
ncbi:MAG: hypothetical protein AB8B61_07620 [Cyclobacteriaceae bacterium]